MSTRVPETTGSVRGAGVTLRYSRWRGGGAPIVVLHGGGQTRHAWEESCAHLGGLGYDVTALDLRGHGESEWAPDQAYGLMDFAADVVAVLPQLGHQRVALLGFSLGGLASLYLTAHHPELCAALMLVDVAPRLETDGVRRIRDFMTRHESFGSLDEVVEALRDRLAPCQTSPARRARAPRLHPRKPAATHDTRAPRGAAPRWLLGLPRGPLVAWRARPRRNPEDPGRRGNRGGRGVDRARRRVFSVLGKRSARDRAPRAQTPPLTQAKGPA